MTDERSQTRVALLMAEGDPLTCPFSRKPGRRFKIRKAIIVDGLVAEKAYLSWETGEWIAVGPGCDIPSECLFDEALGAKLKAADEAYDAETRAVRQRAV